MKTELVIQLSPDWAIHADELQWILSRANKQAQNAEKTLVTARWDHLSFVCTKKAVLERCIREKGAIVDDEGARALARLPDHFDDWKAGRMLRRAA